MSTDVLKYISPVIPKYSHVSMFLHLPGRTDIFDLFVQKNSA